MERWTRLSANDRIYLSNVVLLVVLGTADTLSTLAAVSHVPGGWLAETNVPTRIAVEYLGQIGAPVVKIAATLIVAGLTEIVHRSGNPTTANWLLRFANIGNAVSILNNLYLAQN